jgi:hypothetical protein
MGYQPSIRKALPVTTAETIRQPNIFTAPSWLSDRTCFREGKTLPEIRPGGRRQA